MKEGARPDALKADKSPFNVSLAYIVILKRSFVSFIVLPSGFIIMEEGERSDMVNQDKRPSIYVALTDVAESSFLLGTPSNESKKRYTHRNGCMYVGG